MADEEAPGDYINQRQDLHDCFFLVGREKERISTVKCFLVNYSPYFRAMLLETDMRERGSKKDIVIPDHEPDVFKLMLSYVYGSQNIKFKNIDQAMRFHLLVDKCLMSKLKKISSDYLTQHCTTDICEVLECHVLLEIKQMESRATEMVTNNTESLIASKDFVDLNTAIILFIVKQDSLSISEVELWNGVLKWARHQSGASGSGKMIRKALGEVLKHMRFLAMSSKEFAEQVVPTSVLTSEEMLAVFVSMATGNNCIPSFFCNKKKARTTFNLTLDVDLTPLYENTQQYDRSCTIQVKSKQLQLNSIQLELDSAQFITVCLHTNHKLMFQLDVCSIENECKLSPPFELQPNISYELTVICNQQLMVQHQRNYGVRRYTVNSRIQRRTRPTDILGDSKFCTILSSYGQGMSCLKSLQFTVMSH